MWLDNASKVDMLAYEPYAELVKDIVSTNHMNPLTIGLLGNWGSGKSTLLNLIESNLNVNKEDSKIETITVNAWMFEGYDDAKAALMDVIINTLEGSQSLGDDFKNKFKKLRERIDWFRLGGLAIKKGVPMAMSASLGNPIPIILEAIKGIDISSSEGMEKFEKNFADIKNVLKENSNEESITENIRKFRVEFERLLETSNLSNLVIMVDDLDRCNPDRIIETLEAIKLFLSVKKTTFIIAMDEDVINYSIKRKYPQLDEINSLDISRDYVEKIIQMPIRIPYLSDVEVKNYFLLLICEMHLPKKSLNELLNQLKKDHVFVKGEIITQAELVKYLKRQEQSSDIENVYGSEKVKINLEEHLLIFSKVSDIIASVLKGNPRQTKRFLNTFFIRKRLSEIQKLDLNLSVLAKLMVLEYIEEDLFRTLYKWQLEKGGYALQLKEIEEATLSDSNGLEQIKEKYSKWFKPEIQEWLKTEPTEFSKWDLREYFYLAKDSIKERHSSSLNLTSKEREWVKVFSNDELNDILRNEKLNEFISDSDVDKSSVIKGLIPKFHLNRRGLLTSIISIYDKLVDYRDVLKAEIMKIDKSEVDFTIIQLLLRIKRINEDHYEEIKEFLLKEKKVNSELWERLENPKVKGRE